jgi:NUMOD3 motif
MTPETTLTELQQTVLDHLKRSKEPVSDLEYQHMLTYDDPELSMGAVARAINHLIARQLVTVASTLVIDYEKIKMLAPAGEPKPVVKRRTREFSDEHRRRLSESLKGRKLSEESRRKLSESQKTRWLKRREA